MMMMRLKMEKGWRARTRWTLIGRLPHPPWGGGSILLVLLRRVTFTTMRSWRDGWEASSSRRMTACM